MEAERHSDKMVSDMEVFMKQRCWIPSCGKDCTHWHSSMLVAEHFWRPDNGCEVSGWCVSAGAAVTWKTGHVPDGYAQLSHHEMNSTSVSSSVWIGGLQPRNCAWSWLLTSVHQKWWWQCWKICESWIPEMLTQEWKEHYIQIQDLLNQYVSESDSFLDHTAELQPSAEGRKEKDNLCLATQ